MNKITNYRGKLSHLRRFRLFYSFLHLLCLLNLVQSDLESVLSSVKSTSQSNQDSSEFAAPDDLQSVSRNYGETPGTIQTNDVVSDTPRSHLEQNSAPSANSDGSSHSISTTEAKSQTNERKLVKNGDYSSQGDELESAPGELSNYEESKGGEREKLNDERDDRDGGEISEHGSIDQTKVVAEGEMNSDVYEQEEAIAENSKDTFSNDGSLGEAGGLLRDGITDSRSTLEDAGSLEGGRIVRGDDMQKREMSELSDGADDQKMPESASQEESKESPAQNVDVDSSSREESEGMELRRGGEEGVERETADGGGGGEDSGADRGKGGGEREEEGEGEGEESSDDEMMTFEEFKQKKREEALLSVGGQVEDQPPPVGVANPKHKNNYASVDCGAKVIRHNPEAKNSQGILSENKDAYMINPCSAGIWFIVELCELVSVRSLEIASFELFSSTPKSFKVYASERFEEDATVEWIDLGTFCVEDERRVQQLPLETHVYAKYIKVEMLSHYGDEHYCPLSLLRVLGASMMDIYEESQQVKEQPLTTPPSLVLPEGQDKDDSDDDDDSESQTINKTLLRRAREAVLNMLEHPLRFVNEFIHQDDDNDSEVDHTRSHDQASSATPTPPTADGVRGEDTPTLDCAAGGVCGGGGDEGVKINIDGGPILDDLTSATPLENSKNEQSEPSTLDEDTKQAQEVLEEPASGGEDMESGMQQIKRKERPPDFKEQDPDITPLQSFNPQSQDSKPDVSDTPPSTDPELGSPPNVKDTGANGDQVSRGISLGPTDITTEGATSMMDGGDGGHWNTGGAISVKDKSHPIIGELEEEQENDEERNDANDENSENLSDSRVDADGVVAEKPYDEIIPTSTLVAPEGTESSPSTTSAVDDYDYNKQGHPPHNTNKDGGRIVPTKEGKKEEEELINSRDQEQLPPPVVAGIETTRPTTAALPTPSQITRHPKQDLLIETTTLLREEEGIDSDFAAAATLTGSTSTPHVTSAVPPMPTNRLQRPNIVEGFDDGAVDVANGPQLDTAGLKAEESVTQVPTEDQPHGATNEDTTTSHVDKSNSKETTTTTTVVGVRVHGGGVDENVAAAEMNIPLDNDGTTTNTNANDADDDGTDAMPDAVLIAASKSGDSVCDYSNDGIRVLSSVQTSSATTYTETAESETAVEVKGAGPLSSQDRTISHGTDSPSRPPAASAGDIPTARTIPTSTRTKGVRASETDVSGDKVTAAGLDLSACTSADCSTITQDDKETTALPEPAMSGPSADNNYRAENFNLDISQLSSGGAESSDNAPPSVENGNGGDKLNTLGSNSLNARSSTDSATVTHDKEPNQNIGLPSSSQKQQQQSGSKHQEEFNVDRLEGERMTGMKSKGMEGMEGSQGNNGEYTMTKDSPASQSRSGGGTLTGVHSSRGDIGDRHQDAQRNAMNGMRPGIPDDSDPQNHAHTTPPSHSHSDSPDNNDVTLDSGRSRHPTSEVTDDLPKTTVGDSLDVSRASAVNDRDRSVNPAPPVSSQASPRNASLTEKALNGSLSTQRSLTDTEPQGNGSLANQNARLGDGADHEETQVGTQPTQTQHRNEDSVLEANNGSRNTVQNKSNSSNGNGVHGGSSTPLPPPVQNLPQGAGSGGQGGTVKDREKSVFLRLSNQIQELEANMSLLSSYLDQISTSLKKSKNRTEETTKALDKKILSLNESLSTLSLALSKLASSEVGILRELHSELESEAEELHSLTEKVNDLPDDMMSNHLWLLAVQSTVIMAVFFITCLWLCHANHSLEQKLNAIQTTLSQTQNHPRPSQLTSSSSGGVAMESMVNNHQKSEIDLKQSYNHQPTDHERTKSSNFSQSSSHARSLSFTSMRDLRRKAEDIGDLSRADLKCLTANQSKRWQETLPQGGGPLSSHSLSSLDDRRSTAAEVFSVYEGKKKRKHKSKKATG